MDAEPAHESAHGKGTAAAGKPKPTPKAPTPSAASRTAPAKPTGPAAASAAAESTWLKYRRYIPLSLVALGLALCLAQWGLPAAILGGAGLFLRAKDAGKGASGNPAAPKATLWAGVVSILLGRPGGCLLLGVLPRRIVEPRRRRKPSHVDSGSTRKRRRRAHLQGRRNRLA